jgi:hypothetical protein
VFGCQQVPQPTDKWLCKTWAAVLTAAPSTLAVLQMHNADDEPITRYTWLLDSSPARLELLDT